MVMSMAAAAVSAGCFYCKVHSVARNFIEEFGCKGKNLCLYTK